MHKNTSEYILQKVTVFSKYLTKSSIIATVQDDIQVIEKHHETALLIK